MEKITCMKIVALDLGDQWIGSALSDSQGILAKPYKTVPIKQLEAFLRDLFTQEKLSTVIIGYPKTMRGTESQQTHKVIAFKDKLQKKFPEILFILWDERLSSKRAEGLKKTSSEKAKMQSHSIAAAFILESYLTFKHNLRVEQNES
jgi:putative holliday junction resolvase